MKKLIVLLMIIILIGCKKSSSKSEDDEKVLDLEYHVSLVAVGDNLIHNTIYNSVNNSDSYDFKPIYHEIKPYIKQFDLAFINQETILGGKELGLSSYPRFNSPIELGFDLIDTGFNLFSLANNHTLDRGEKAILNSLTFFDSQDVVYSGALKDKSLSNVKIFTKNNIKFAFVAYTTTTNGINHPQNKEYLANVFSYDKVKDDLAGIKNEVDFLIVSMHFGNEYEDYPSLIQKEQAQFLTNLGAYLIIGHHPHVIQPIDLINNKTYVVYSLGNFLSDQVGIDRKIGMAFSIDFQKNISKDSETKKMVNPKVKLLYHYKESNQFFIKDLNSVNNLILNDYQSYYDKKKKLIKTYINDIEFS